MLKADKLVYILGEEMARHSMQLILDNWVKPYVDISAFEYYSLSVADRANSDDKVLKDAISAGGRVKAIFKEPTITPTAEQMTDFGFAGKKLGSPNGKMRQAWNGFAISRDPIFVPGLEDKFGYKGTVIFDRHAIGGEYQALYANHVATGKIKTVHVDAAGAETVLNEQPVEAGQNAVVTYVNDYNNLPHLAANFFNRCLEKGCKPFVVTKKTVFKWQEPFYDIIAKEFEAYRAKFEAANLVEKGGKLPHLLSDDAAMRSIRWKEGKFGMVAHNYDGDWLTDEQAQVFGSPGLISSVMTGVAADGAPIKMFEAAHGTMADLWEKHKKGEETSVNPIGMVHGLAGAMVHSAKLVGNQADMQHFAENCMMKSLYEAYAEGKGSRDFCGANGLNTNDLVRYVGEKIKAKI